MTVTVKIPRKLQEQEGMAELVADFRNYLKTGKEWVPSYFGRDVRYERPADAVLNDLRHIHLKPTEAEEHIETPAKAWDDAAPQFYRTSNKFLVYTCGESNQDCYIILAIVFPRAHELAEDGDHMAYLIKMADSAKKQF